MSEIKNMHKYLSKQNLQNWKIELVENELFSNIIVIPAIAEFENIQNLITSLRANNLENINKTLALFIFNNKGSDSQYIKDDNLKSLSLLKNLDQTKKSNLVFGFVDCSTEGKELPEKDGGVGLARKIGMDLALNQFDYNSNNAKVIISLDADCLVSENYLNSINLKFNSEKVKAAVINFEHQLSENDEQNLAIINYESFLRYYLLGLKMANSPFAFHTIGSTFAFDTETYVKVGGMNKRKAGEDFYFLQKLAKIVKINKVANATVFPSSRISWRVPFGTGPRIKRFLSKQNDEYKVYSPKSFIVLKKWLKIFNSQIYDKNFNIIPNWANTTLEESKKINIELYNFLISQNFTNDWEKILKNSKSENQLTTQKILWMDGFRTLKLIHLLRDNCFPSEDMFESINTLLKHFNENSIPNSISKIPQMDVQMKVLNKLRSLT